LRDAEDQVPVRTHAVACLQSKSSILSPIKPVTGFASSDDVAASTVTGSKLPDQQQVLGGDSGQRGNRRGTHGPVGGQLLFRKHLHVAVGIVDRNGASWTSIWRNP